jgi:SAM-dependent methyltransferase
MPEAGDDMPGRRAACPVCRAAAAVPWLSVDRQTYWRCPACEARFLDPAQRPDRTVERAFYRTHENDAGDRGYRRFMARLVDPLLDRLAPGAEGLDYGCGPASALAAMLDEAGHGIAQYDPLFRPDRSVFDRQYDFVACAETAEHFHDPAGEFARLARLLRPGGWLAVMTCFQTDDARFADWHYRRDPTHVVFYRAATFRRIAAQLGWSCDIPRKDVALLRRPAAA